MGALWSLWLALAEPDRVASLVLLGCPANVLGTSAPFPFRLLSVPRLNARMLAMEPPSTQQARTTFRRMGHDPASLSPEFIELMNGAGEGPVEDLAVLREEVPAAVGSADHTPHAATDKHRVVEGAASANTADIMTERLVGGQRAWRRGGAFL